MKRPESKWTPLFVAAVALAIATQPVHAELLEKNQRFLWNPFTQMKTYLAEVEGFDQEREWSQTFWSALAPYHTSVYVNFLMDEGEERTRQAYGSDKYDRLKALKRKYDPENFFRLNQNIPPA